MAVAQAVAAAGGPPRDAFDAVAATYDSSNRDNVLLEAMRIRSLRLLCSIVPRGSRVLDLGCGPGTDFAAMLEAGYIVTALERSAGMVQQARRRAAQLARPGAIDVRPLAIEQLQDLGVTMFDAAYSSFGPLNCVDELAQVAAGLTCRLRPGGVLVASVIGRWCPWELALYSWKRDFKRMRLRFSRAVVAVPLGPGTVQMRYYSPAEFERPFLTRGFTRIRLRSLGLFMPPPYLHAFANRHPHVITFLQTVEDRAGGWPLLRDCGDHFLIALRKC